MKKVLSAIVLAVPLSFAQLSEETEVETLLFDQCNCQDKLFQTQPNDFFANTFDVQGADLTSCPAEVNELSGISLEAGIDFNFDDEAGEGELSTLARTEFFRNNEGERGSFFFRVGLKVKEELVSKEVSLVEVPGENFVSKLTVNSDLTTTTFTFEANFENDESFVISNEIEEIDIAFGEQDFPAIGRQGFACFGGASPSCQLLGDVLNVPVEPSVEEFRQVKLLVNSLLPANDGVIQFNFFEFGRNFLSVAEAAAIAEVGGEIIAIEEKFATLEVPEATLLPNVVANVVNAEEEEENVIDINALFSELVEGTTFELKAEGLSGFLRLDRFAEDGRFTYIPPEDFEGEETFVVTIGNENLDCTFDLTVTVDVFDDGGDVGVIVGVSVGVVAVAAIVGGVVYMKKKKKKELKEAEVKSDAKEAAVASPKSEI